MVQSHPTGRAAKAHRRDECQKCGATRMMRQHRRRWLSVRKSASIGRETARTWPADVPPELLPAFGDPGFCVREVAPCCRALRARGQALPAARVQACDGVTPTLDLEAGVLPVASWYRRQ